MVFFCFFILYEWAFSYSLITIISLSLECFFNLFVCFSAFCVYLQICCATTFDINTFLDL